MSTAKGLVMTFNTQVIDLSSNGMIGEPTLHRKCVPGVITCEVHYDEPDTKTLRKMLSEEIATMYSRDV